MLVPWGELSGAVGDLGTLLPLMVGMVQSVNLDLGTTLISTGLSSMLCGLAFNIPMPIQPMKSIVALSIANALTCDQALLAGLFVGVVTLLGGAIGLIDFLSHLVPVPVIRGVQLQVGGKLTMKGVSMALRPTSSGARWDWHDFAGGAAALLFLLVTTMPASEGREGLIEGREQEATEGGRAGNEEPKEGGRKKAKYSPLQVGRGEAVANQVLEGSNQSHRISQAQDPLVAKAGTLNCKVIQTGQQDVEVGGQEDASEHSRVVSGARCESSPLLPQPPQMVYGRQGGDADNEGVDQCRARNQPGRDEESSTMLEGVGGCSGSDGSRNNDCAVPSCLLLVVLGVGLTLFFHPEVLHVLKFGPSVPRLLQPTAHDVYVGCVHGGLPQLPLTLLNSVIGLSQLASDRFPVQVSPRWSHKAVAISVGLINIPTLLGSMPVCHGAGGLAAQMRAGARTGTASVILGGLKVTLGLLFGSSLFSLLSLFPQNLLGALLVMSGIELAAAVRQETCPRGMSLCLLTALVGLALDNTPAGVAAGILAAASTATWDKFLPWAVSCFCRPRDHLQ